MARDDSPIRVHEVTDDELEAVSPTFRDAQLEKVERWRRLARELDEATHELSGDRGSSKVHAAATELRDQAAAIARRLKQDG